MKPKAGDLVYISTYSGVTEAIAHVLTIGMVFLDEYGNPFFENQIPECWIFTDKKSAAKKAMKLTMINIKDAEHKIRKWQRQYSKLERMAK